MDTALELICRERGIHLQPSVTDFLPEGPWRNDWTLAMDAQPTLITVANTGIPAFLTNYIDPKVIEVLVTPMKSAMILGEAKNGDWTTDTAYFTVVESTGETSGYGDYSDNGESNANMNWPQRQQFRFQTITQWGDLELQKASLAKIDWASRLNISSALNLEKFRNKMNFYGIAGLQLYGITNDPKLSAALTPATKIAGGTTWAAATAQEIFTDVLAMFTQLQVQVLGLIERDARMKLCLPPTVEPNLLKVSTYNVQAIATIKAAFPNLEVISAVEYAITGGNLVQLIAEEVEGQETGTTAFSEKMRAHPIVTELSAWRQKKSAGGYGAVYKQPMNVVGMLGI